MLKMGGTLLSLLCLLVAVLVLWQTSWFPENLPDGAVEWARAWFRLFDGPVTAAALLALSAALVLSATFAGEFLMGLVLSLLALLSSLLCLAGILGARHAGFAAAVEKFLQ